MYLSECGEDVFHLSFLLPSSLSICLARPASQVSMKYRDAFTHLMSIVMHLRITTVWGCSYASHAAVCRGVPQREGQGHGGHGAISPCCHNLLKCPAHACKESFFSEMIFTPISHTSPSLQAICISHPGCPGLLFHPNRSLCAMKSCILHM